VGRGILSRPQAGSVQERAMETVKVGVIGAGFMGQAHAAAYVRHPAPEPRRPGIRQDLPGRRTVGAQRRFSPLARPTNPRPPDRG